MNCDPPHAGTGIDTDSPEGPALAAADRAAGPVSFPPGGIAAVVGATGGLGAALLERLQASGCFLRVEGLGRRSDPRLDLLDESSIARCAAHLAALGELRLVVDATGVLHSDRLRPEKSWRDIDPAAMEHAFAINAIGPALLMKHFLPLLPRHGKSVFATLSAKVGSIGDNRLGGWYSYRASKAALNQLVRTAAIELRRRSPDAICLALHPGTVATPLSQPFAKAGLEVRSPAAAAERLTVLLQCAKSEHNGTFLDHSGALLPW